MPVTPNKTLAATPPIPWQIVTAGSQVFSAVLDFSTVWAAAFGISLARRSGTAFTTGWPNVRIEVSTKSNVNKWISIYPYQMQVGASIASTTLNGAVSVGAATIVATAATNITAGDILFLGDTSTANYELVRVKSVSGTTITLEEITVFAHANGAIVTDQAEMAFPDVDVRAYTRGRIVIDNAGSGVDIAVEVAEITMDSF